MLFRRAKQKKIALSYREILPYCVMEISKDNFVFLNRNYKPIGFNTGQGTGNDKFIIYEDYPITFNLSKSKLKLLEYVNKAYYFYSTDTHPDNNAQTRKRYFDLLSKFIF
jgi:hypothetical protein